MFCATLRRSTIARALMTSGERGGRRRALRAQSACGQGDGAEALAALAIFPMHTASLTFATLGVSVDRMSYKDTSAKQG